MNENHKASARGIAEQPGPLAYQTTQQRPQGQEWVHWTGQQLGEYFALDCETEVTQDPTTIPQLAMVSVSDGQVTCILHPQQVAEFIEQHLGTGRHMVCHHIGFDFWVLHRHLRTSQAQDALRALWTAANQQRLHDTMLLACLVGIATVDEDQQISLADLAKQKLGIVLDKDTYRLRYAETIGADWNTLEPGWFEYPATDAAVTYRLFCMLWGQAKTITTAARVPTQYGMLTESIQVQAAICLAHTHRLGVHIDTHRAQELRTELEQQIQQTIAQLETMEPTLFHRNTSQGYLFDTGRGISVSMNQQRLSSRLQAIAEQHQLPAPSTKTGKLSTSVNEYWKEHRLLDPFVDAYCSYREQTKLLSFFDALRQPRIHPRYRALVRTGRTSASGPNIQQLPTGSKVREAVIPAPGYLFLCIDYAAIELRTLAAVCQARFGFSKLADVIRSGTDPHSYTAAMFAGVGLDEFKQLPDAKQLRQQAKAVNFGLPAGLGAASLVTYARFSYGVVMTLEQATQFRTMLTETVYPELALYLSEDPAQLLAISLQADLTAVRATLNKQWQYGLLRRVIGGHKTKADGTPYTESTLGSVWEKLGQLNRNPALAEAIALRDTTEASPLHRLLHSPVATPTGRIRGQVAFTAARNTPFSGLAADGAKLAMWNLLLAGYRVAAFIHDEFVIELPLDADHTREAERVNGICCSSMQRVVGNIPVACEYSLTDRWYKQATAVRDADGKLRVWQPH
jgi:DNA polymerase I-like protein with 3'-5' exonuclease and polymerase domains